MHVMPLPSRTATGPGRPVLGARVKDEQFDQDETARSQSAGHRMQARGGVHAKAEFSGAPGAPCTAATRLAGAREHWSPNVGSWPLA